MQMTVKQGVINLINNLNDDCNYDDIMAEIYFKQKVEEGLHQVHEGKVISHDEAKQRLAKWIK